MLNIHPNSYPTEALPMVEQIALHPSPQPQLSIYHLFFVCVYRNGCLVLNVTPTSFISLPVPLISLSPIPCPLPLFSSLLSPPLSFPQTVELNPTHGENSPSLCPTISSVIVTSLYTFPLCTWNLSPTKLGRIVAPRACVLMGVVRSPVFGRTMGRLCFGGEMGEF